jgi:hypothetical protein
MQRSVKSTQRKVRMLELIVDGTGTAALSGPASNQATLVDNGTGDYTISFNENFSQLPVCIPVCLTADCCVDTMVPAVGSVQVTLVDNTDGTTAKDGDFHILIVGSDSADKH